MCIALDAAIVIVAVDINKGNIVILRHYYSLSMSLYIYNSNGNIVTTET